MARPQGINPLKHPPARRRQGRTPAAVRSLAAAWLAVLVCLAAPTRAAVLNPGDIIFGTSANSEFGTGGLFHFNPVTSVVTEIVPTDAGLFNGVGIGSIALDGDFNIVVGTMSGSGFGNGGLFRIDQVTHQATALSNDPFINGVGAMVIEDSGDILVGTRSNSQFGVGQLFRVNGVSGAVAGLGNEVFDGGIDDMRLNAAGNLIVGTRSNTPGGAGAIFTVNTVTGVATQLGTQTYDGGLGGLEIDANGDILAGSISNGPGGTGDLYRVNPTTGVATAVGAGGFFNGLSATGLDFSGDVIAGTGSNSLFGAGQLLRINPVTGQVTTLTGPDFFNAITAIAVVTPQTDFTGGNNVTITGATQNVIGSPHFFSTSTSATLDIASVVASLGAQPASVRTGSGQPNNQDGDLTLAALLDYNGKGDTEFWLRASDDVIINQAILDSVPGSPDSMDLLIYADNDKQSPGLPGATGLVDINAAVALGAGILTSSGIGFDNTGGAITAGQVNLTHSGNVLLGASVASPGDVDVDAGGNVTVQAPVDARSLAATAANITLGAAGDVKTTGGAGITHDLNLDATSALNLHGQADAVSTRLDASSIGIHAGTLDTTSLTATSGSFVQDGGIVAVTGAASFTQTASASFAGEFSANTLGVTAPIINVQTGANVTVTTFTPTASTELHVQGGLIDSGSASLAAVSHFKVTGGVYESGSVNLNQPGAFTHTGGTIRADGGTLTPRGTTLTLAGAGPGDLPTIELTGGATSVVSGATTVGDAGQNGRLNVLGGSTFTTHSASVGSSGQGTLESAGAGSHATVTTTLTVGAGGLIDVHTLGRLTANQVNLAAGGTFNALSGAIIAVAGQTTVAPSGTLTVNNAALTTNSLNLATGGTLNLVGTGAINSTLTVTTADTTQFNLTGGTLTAPLFVHNSVANFTGNSLRGFGTINAPFSGGFSSHIIAENGHLTLGRANSFVGFSTNGFIDIAPGAELTLLSRNFATVGPAVLIDGGTLHAPNGLALGIGKSIAGHGTINAVIAADVGSRIFVENGNLSLGKATAPNGYFSSGELYTYGNTATLLDSNQAYLGSYAEMGYDDGLGQPSSLDPGAIVSSNGLILDFGRVLAGFGVVDTPNDILEPFLVNGSVIGRSFFTINERIHLNGYVTGIGTLENVIINGTHSPGLSPAITHATHLAYGPTAVLVMELGGTIPGSQHDQLILHGSALFDGTLMVTLINSFVPEAGDEFEIFDYTDLGFGLLNWFDQYQLPALSPGLGWDTSTLTIDGTIRVTVIPESASLAMLVLGVLTILLGRRRKGMTACLALPLLILATLL